MFCAKTHNMGFVSPTDNKTPIVPRGGVPFGIVASDKDRLRHKGELRPSLNPSASQNGKHCTVFFVSSVIGLLRWLPITLSATRVRNDAGRSAASRSHIVGAAISICLLCQTNAGSGATCRNTLNNALRNHFSKLHPAHEF